MPNCHWTIDMAVNRLCRRMLNIYRRVVRIHGLKSMDSTSQCKTNVWVRLNQSIVPLHLYWLYEFGRLVKILSVHHCCHSEKIQFKRIITVKIIFFYHWANTILVWKENKVFTKIRERGYKLHRICDLDSVFSYLANNFCLIWIFYYPTLPQFTSFFS